MTLNNYWWLLIWMFIVGGLSIVFVSEREEVVLGKRERRWNWFAAFAAMFPYILWAAGRTDRFGDTGQYRATFKGIPVGLSQMAAYISSRTKAKGFFAFEYLFKTLISQSDKAFFFAVAFIQIICLVYIYRKYSRNYWLSMFFFIASTDYLSWVHNGMRQFLAVAIIFLALPLLVKRRYLFMCLVVLAASTIHSSALIVLPFIFIVNGRAWNVRTVLFLVAIILSVLFLDRTTSFITNAMVNTEYERDIFYLAIDDGTNILRVLFYSVPAIMSLVYRPYINRADDPLINVCANLSIVAAGFYVFSYFTSGILMGAIPIYFSLANYILLPWLINEVFSPASAVFIDTAFVGVYSYFFYYQVGVTWKLL